VAKEFSAVELIIAKRENQELTTEQIDWLVHNYTTGVIADEQMSAMTMAILLNGMNRREIKDLTMAMIASGERLDFSSLPMPTADKHSTGGVGDKITLMVAPLVAVFGVAVPQLSGRGLGHTGGTLDKMEAIPGWQANLSNQQMLEQLRDVGAVVCAAGSGLAPADKKLYALRDVTGTVEAIPLIASSIMSKKIAEGTASLVLDVKVGSGAFKAVEVLAGGGAKDLVEITVALATEMLRLSGKTDIDVASALADGRAMDKWVQMISAQGGDPKAELPKAKHEQVVYATESGILNKLDALAVGTASWRLGAGRARKEDPVQFGAGVILHAKRGDQVTKGEPLLTLFTDEENRFARALEALDGGIEIGVTAKDQAALILDRIQS